MKGRERLAPLISTSTYADDFVRLQLAHLDQLRAYSTISAEVNLEFPGIDALRERYNQIRRRSDESDTTWDSSHPPSRRGSRRGSKLASTLFPPTYSMGTKPWPRRAALDRHGGRVDPLTQVELALRDADERQEAMRGVELDARGKMQDLIRVVDHLYCNKNEVRDELERHVEQASRPTIHCTAPQNS